MTLIKTSLLNGIAVLVRMVTLLGINKLLALYVGPAGYAIVGQFQSAIQMITTFASGAINTGVVRYTAEYENDEKKLLSVWGTSSTISLGGALLTSIFIIVFQKKLAVYFLKDENLSDVFFWFAAFLLLFVLNALLLAMLNGKKSLKAFVTANIAGSVISLLLTAYMTYEWKLRGALIALGIFQSVSFFVTFFLCLKQDWFKVRYLFSKIDLEVTKNLMHYTLMALSSAIIVPLGQIYIRNLLGEKLSWEDAGYWEAMWKLSSAYLLFITSTLSVYYLPRLSVLKEKKELKKEVINCFKVVIPLVLVTSFFIYLLRFWIIKLLFSKDFISIQSLFLWQMVGDTLKTASWLLGYIYIARGFSGLYILSELFFVTIFCLLIDFFLPHFGLEATAISHAISYFFHLIFIFFSLKIKREL